MRGFLSSAREVDFVTTGWRKKRSVSLQRPQELIPRRLRRHNSLVVVTTGDRKNPNKGRPSRRIFLCLSRVLPNRSTNIHNTARMASGTPKSHRAALDAAVAALPTADDDSWTVPDKTLKAAGLADDVAAARKFVLQFALWARSAIDRLPPAAPIEMQATDFNDYYKIVMSRVQFLYSQAASGGAPDAVPQLPVCCFQTQLRRRPAFRKQGVDSCSGVFDLSGAHKPSTGSMVVGSLETSQAALRAALTAVGARKFDAATLRALVAQRSPKAEGIETNLTPINDAWIAALDGKQLFTLLPEGAAFSGSTSDVECRIDLEDGHAVLLAQGPWYRVTFCETPLLQCMSRKRSHQPAHAPARTSTCPHKHQPRTHAHARTPDPRRRASTHPLLRVPPRRSALLLSLPPRFHHPPNPPGFPQTLLASTNPPRFHQPSLLPPTLLAATAAIAPQSFSPTRSVQRAMTTARRGAVRRV